MTTRVDGLDRLLRQIAALPDAVVAAQGEALEQAAYELADVIEARVPRRTGQLAGTIDYCAGEPPAGAMGRASGKATASAAQGGDNLRRALTDKGLLFSVYAGDALAFWGPWVEWGTRATTTGEKISSKGRPSRVAGRTHPGTRAQPFFFPTIRARKASINARVRAASNKAVKMIAETA